MFFFFFFIESLRQSLSGRAVSQTADAKTLYWKESRTTLSQTGDSPRSRRRAVDNDDGGGSCRPAGKAS